ncbi:MAG: amidohydrolase family protein [Gemmatimonadetes bacterium]|nr:amidohydrolase family protein [Gemmatimonadota bacterium]
MSYARFLSPLLLVVAGPLRAQRPARPDTVEARAIFEANISAIHRRDRARYLSYYLEAPTFARNGPGGLELGYAPFAAQRDTTWPDSLIATDLRLVPIRPGVVYGQYRYRVTQRGETSSGTSERIFVRTPRGWRIAVSTAFAAPRGTPPAPVALVGARLVNGTGGPAIPDAVVVVVGGRIACAGPRTACAPPAGLDTMSLRGHWIVPGLVDAHVHFSQTGWVDGRPDALDLRDRYPYERVVADLEAHPERFLRAYLCSGVTAVFDVGGYPWTWALRRRAESDLLAPHVAAAGPLLSTVDRPTINLPDTKQIFYVPNDSVARAAVRAHVARGTDAVKIWYIVPAGADTTALKVVVRAIADETRRLGARLIVHATGLWEAKDALRAGTDVLVHSVYDQPVDDEFLALARERRVIYTPTLTVFDGYRQVGLRHFEPHYDLACVDSTTAARARSTDSLAPSPSAELVQQRVERTRRQLATAQANLLAIHRAGITVAMGTDAGNPLTLHGPAVFWEMEAMQQAGLTPFEVLVAATLGSARAMGRERDLGTVEAGKIADLVVLGSDPLADIGSLRDLRYVMRGGALTVPRLLAPR